MTSINVSTFLNPLEYERFVKLLELHFAFPLGYPLSGANFEVLFAHAIDGIREEQKLLFDIHKGGIGWSLKTLINNNAISGRTFEVVIQRCDILKDKSISIESPIEVLGEKIVNHFGAFYTKSLKDQNITDPRSGILLRDRLDKNFVLFQEKYRVFQPNEIQWRWASEDKKSLMGYFSDLLVLRWYRSGTQLFAIYHIPINSHFFAIEWKRADLNITSAYFESQGLIKTLKK